MVDRDKVIRALECCAVGAECDHCPYSAMNKAGYEGCYQMHQNALALLKAQEQEAVDAPKPDIDVGCWYDITHNYTLEQVVSALKAQEPRVITAEQLEDWLEPVYLEDIFYGARWALIADFSANWFTFKVTEPGFLKDEVFHYSEYGRRWRCWTFRTTDEQREAVKWE